MSATTDRTFAEVRPLFDACSSQEDGSPIEWAFHHAGIPILYIAGLTQPYGLAVDTRDLAALLPEALQIAAPAARATALRTCLREWEEGGQYRAAGRIWCGLTAWVDEHQVVA